MPDARPLDPRATLALIRTAAREGRFLAFGDVAFASGVPWPRARRGIGAHLAGVCRLALAEGGPLVSSRVVNRRHLGTGLMEPETLAGFLAAARELGFAWDDGLAFLRAQQEDTVRWARSGRRVGFAPPPRPSTSAGDADPGA